VADPQQLRGVVLTEDKRSERFFRHLITCLGYDKRNFRFLTAPSGIGSAEAWVLKRYPEEVQVIRSKNFQRSLCLIAVRDGDSEGVSLRKQQMDDALTEANKTPRAENERIALPVPTWSIENWLLYLLKEPNVNEERQVHRQDLSWKQAFARLYGESNEAEAEALRGAARAWSDVQSMDLPSLVDGRREIARLSLG